MLLARANARARRPPSEPRESLPCPDVREYEQGELSLA